MLNLNLIQNISFHEKKNMGNIVTVYMLQVPEPWHVNVFLGSVKIFWCRTIKGNISTFIHMDIQILYLGILYDIVTDDNKAMGGSVLELSW